MAHSGQSHSQRHLRARGHLTYLQYIRLVKNMWEKSNPQVPLVSTGDRENAVYPSILHALDLRTTRENEPKPRFRETIEDGDNNTYVIFGQRFDNIVSFTAITESDPELADEIIESFEDFMQGLIPALKQAGISELVYNRRYPDTETDRTGKGIVSRSVSYRVTTEKVTSVNIASYLNDISLSIETNTEQDLDL